MRERAYPLVWRVVAGVLVAVSRGSLPLILLLLAIREFLQTDRA